VAHACNPGYSGDRDQEDRGSKPARANSSRDLTLKKPITKKAGGVAQMESHTSKCEALSSNPSTTGGKKKIYIYIYIYTNICIFKYTFREHNLIYTQCAMTKITVVNISLSLNFFLILYEHGEVN
jgi:hypothetical protein